MWVRDSPVVCHACVQGLLDPNKIKMKTNVIPTSPSEIHFLVFMKNCTTIIFFHKTAFAPSDERYFLRKNAILPLLIHAEK